MPQTGTANLTDFEPGNASATASLDEFQPELLPEVKQAIAAVPRPKFQPPAPSLTQRLLDTSGTPQPQLPSSVKEFSERLNEPNHPAPGAFEGHPENIGEYVPRTIGRVAKAVPRLVNYRNQPSSETAKAATDIVSGAGEAALPFAPFSVAAAPLSTAVGFGAGALASEGAGKVAHGKVSPETEELIRSLAFWAPSVAGQLAGIHGLAADTLEGKAAGVSAFGGRVAAGAKITPEEAAFGAKVGPFKGTVRIPRTQPQAQPAIEPPTIEGPAPQVPHPGAPVDNVAEGASNTVAMANEEAQAMRMVSGLPPTPPPPPVPPPPGPPIPPEIANGHISPETVQKIGETIAKVPPALRAQATLEAHQTLSQSILQQGKVVTPDGTLEIVTKPEQADKVAQRIINDEVKRQEKIIAEQTNESGQVGVGVGVAPTETAPLSKIEQALRARRARKADQEQATQASPIAPAPATPSIEQPEAPSQNIGTASLDDFTPQSSSPAVPPKTEGGTAALADLAPTNFLKGDQVVLPDGAKAKVSWVSQKMSIVRVKTDDGQVLSIGARKLKSVQPEPITPAYPPAEVKPVRESAASTEREQPAKVNPREALKDALVKLNDGKPLTRLPSKVVSDGHTWEYKGDQFFKDGKLLEKTEDLVDATDALGAVDPEWKPKGRGKLIEGTGKLSEPTQSQWSAESVAKAVREGKEVPLEVLSQHPEALKFASPALKQQVHAAQAAPGTTISKEAEAKPTPKTESVAPPVVAPKETTPSVIEGDRGDILKSEIKDLQRQREEVDRQIAKVGWTHTPTEQLKAARELHQKLLDKQDERARLNGEPTRAEKRAVRETAATKPFSERPVKALKYGEPEQSQHWQVTEPDYIEKRFAERQASYEKAVPEKQAEVAKLKPGTNKYITEESNLKYWKDMLKKYRERDPRQAQTFKNEYTELVKKAVSQGRPVPDEVIDQNSEFTLAKSARERYEKGRHTSFANRSAAIDDTMQKEEGFKVKRQDGKPIPEDQAKEISDGVSDIVEVLGPALRDMMRGTDLTIAHTNGRHPFLSDAAGQYHPVDRTISAGVKDFLGRPVHALAHELGHWMDYEAGRVLGVRHYMLTKSGSRSPEAKFISEADAQKDQFAALGKARQDLYTLARNSMTDTREVSRMLKLTKMSDLPDAERAEVERVKVVLGHYWKDPRELWARMFEQYIADKLGRESMATETIERYLKAPAWWDKEAWAKLKPMVEQEIAKQMDALRERYAPTTESTEPFASRPTAVEARPSSEDAKSIRQRAPVAGQQGSDTTLNTANGNLPAKYRVVEAADLLPSHNPQTFGRNLDYPGGIQERTYDTSKEAQARVIQQAQNYDPNYTINTNPDAVNGPPIITPDGTVLGGNSRAMSTQRLYKAGKGELYKEALLARAQTFGLDKEAIRLMKEPVLVREVAHPESLEATRRLASDLNKSMTGTLGVSERAVSAGKSITRDSLAKVAAMMDDIGADASLRDLMRERGRDLVSLLVKDGVITERERPQFVETATGGLSEEGKTFVERALLGSVVDDPRLMDSTPKAVLNKLDGSLAALSSLSPRTDPYNILPLVRAALHDHAEIASLGSNVETFLNQSGLFGGDRSPAIDAMTRLLVERPTVVKQKFRQFAQDAGFDVQGQATLGLMEPVGPAKAFNEAFGTNLTEEALADSIVRAAQIDPIIGGSREAGTSGPTETSAGSVQQRPAGEARPGSEAGTGAPTQGKSQPKTGNQLDLLADESGSFEPGKLAAPVAELFKQDVAPALSKAGVGLRDTAALFIKGLYPRIEESNPVGRWLKAAAPSDAVDELMRLKGDRAKALANFDGVMSGMEKMFDHLPEEARIDFIHRIQTGAKQPSTELQQIANLFKQVQDIERSAEQDAMNLGRKGKAVELSRKENYFHNWWSTPPGTDVAEDEETRVSRLSSPRRPLEGSRGYNKRQSYTLKEGIAAGGKPETTNPVRIMRHRIEDGLKFVTARKAWQGLHDLDLRTFVGQGERPPAGFDKVDDRIARVYFPAESGEGTIKAGEWYVEANTARLLNNMLSRDLIRGNAAGRSLMWLKNASTALELGLSPFHAVFETIEAASSQLALGMQRSFNLGIRGGDPTALAKGIYEMATSPVAPITMAREGAALPAYIEARSRLGEIGITQFGKHQIEGNQPHGVKEAIAHFGEVRKVAGIRRLLLQYPDLDQLVDDMFTGGLIIGQHRDYQTRAFGKTAAEAWSAGNHLGAILRAGIGLPQTMMKPLFQWYIPNLKYSLFLKQMSEQAAEHAAELADGSLTRATLARRVADSVENRFGELNFDNLFLNRTVKTVLQFAFRSITYKLGTARELSGAAGGQAAEVANWARQAYDSEYRESAEASGALPRLDPRASWFLSLIFYTVAIGTVAAKLLSGKYPWEHLEDDKKEGGGDLRHLFLETVHPRTGDTDSRGKPVRMSLPTYWKDVEHASSNPSQYILSSLSTTLSKGMDLAENRDYFGNYVYNPNASLSKKIEQAGKYAFPTPFAVSNYQRGQQMGEPKTAWLSAFGFPRAPNNLDFTPAERLAQSLLKAREAPHTPEEMEAWREKRQAFEKGQLSPAAARSFIKEQRESYLERQFKHLQYTEAVKVYGVATEQEKPLLNRLLREKRQNLVRRHATIPAGSD